jgi:hypothetical protein
MMFIGLTGRQYQSTVDSRENLDLNQPSNGSLMVDLGESPGRFYGMNYIQDDGEDLRILSAREDSMLLNTVKIRIAKSKDTLYHANLFKIAKGKNPMEAEQTVGSISFPVRQEDSILYLPKGFVITKENKFHNQQVILVIEVPTGKKIRIDRKTDWYDWFNIGSGYGGIKINVDGDEIGNYSWRHDVWYVMTDDGLERIKGRSRTNKDMNVEWNSNEKDKEIEIDVNGIRIREKGKDTPVTIKSRVMINEPGQKSISSIDQKSKMKRPHIPELLGSISLLDLLKLDL